MAAHKDYQLHRFQKVQANDRPQSIFRILIIRYILVICFDQPSLPVGIVSISIRSQHSLRKTVVVGVEEDT
jgi:hypothetical protein